MKVERCHITTNYVQKKPTISFKHVGMQSLKNIDIGAAQDGLIGNIKVRKGNNTECLLNVIKKSLGDGYENYSVINDFGTVIGETNLKIKNYTSYDRWEYSSDPSHVFIDGLFNYSNPTTPYYRNLEQYKDIGIRLMQIALKRSYETSCNGNLKLISKNESKDWYKHKIGMTEEFPEVTNSKYGFNIHNPNSLILPQEAKEYLSSLQGGL